MEAITTLAVATAGESSSSSSSGGSDRHGGTSSSTSAAVSSASSSPAVPSSSPFGRRHGGEEESDQHKGDDEHGHHDAATTSHVLAHSSSRALKRCTEISNRARAVPNSNMDSFDFDREVRELRGVYKLSGSTVGPFRPPKKADHAVLAADAIVSNEW